MTIARYSSVRDMTARHRAAAAGHSSTFLCAACGSHAGLFGRRLRMVRGLKTWVCAGCARGRG